MWKLWGFACSMASQWKDKKLLHMLRHRELEVTRGMEYVEGYQNVADMVDVVKVRFVR